ncbi:YihY/virulence factor BrkB family protein [Falsibacillus albus]|uniref:YihY/virulence factor BrkB family protein n=2 Tax=Falsibacillus albus TaxID=2478915 RepID=A0A3L7JYL4_9BACI|nr:YihY/virulence factor BrkB family protein [Falsibacillus albus]
MNDKLLLWRWGMNSVNLLKEMGLRFFTLRVYDLSAQMAYYFLLSVFPFLLLIYSLVGYIPIQENAILEMIKPYAPESTYRLINDTLAYTVTEHKGNLLSLSLFFTLWLSSMGFQSMKRVLNEAYGIKGKHHFLKEVLEGLIMTVGFMFAILISVFVPVIERLLRHTLNEAIPMEQFYKLQLIVQWGMGSLFLLLFFLILFYFSPNIKLEWSTVIPGAVFSTICWQLVSLGFAAYVKENNYSVLYGQVGSIVVLMLWFYLSAMIIILGGILNAIISTGAD